MRIAHFIFLMDKFIVFHGEAVNPRGTADSVTNSAIVESRFPGGSNIDMNNALMADSI